MHGTEIERPLAMVMTGGLVTSTLFMLLVLPTIYPWFVRANREASPRPLEGETQTGRKRGQYA
jgi:Cu/Ag efflux pump CusA